ncbi:MAG: hemerythrin domain-containing protein [Bacteroidales bacterium]|nr:hemerythrin domain-containing protein [Bacteroidales bacterium]
METTSQDLMREHKVIMIALDVIEKMYEKVRNDQDIDYVDVEEIIEFLKIFADKCHHGKEEDFLFPALEEVGVKNQNGPIGLMLAQHRQGRELIKKMQESIANKTINKKAFAFAAYSYVNLLRNHIEKEDTFLFPLSDTKLSAFTQKRLMDNFENLEKNVIGEGKHEELHAQLEKFQNKYLGTGSS